jgi:hypothetical protein
MEEAGRAIGKPSAAGSAWGNVAVPRMVWAKWPRPQPPPQPPDCPRPTGWL